MGPIQGECEYIQENSVRWEKERKRKRERKENNIRRVGQDKEV